jgi:hypothetical protein
MSPTRSRYRELGLEPISLEDNLSRNPKRAPMAEEKRDVREEDPIKLLIMEALAEQRNEMLDKFSEILQ